MNFDDQRNLEQRSKPAGFPEPKAGERICETCLPRVALVLDMSRPGYEYRCPRCGRYEEWFGLRFLSKETNHQPPTQ